MALTGSMKDPAVAANFPNASATLSGSTRVGDILHAVYDLTGGSGPLFRRAFKEDGSITDQVPVGQGFDVELNTHLATGTDHV